MEMSATVVMVFYAKDEKDGEKELQRIMEAANKRTSLVRFTLDGLKQGAE